MNAVQLDEKVKSLKRDLNGNFLQMAECLYEIREKKHYQALGYETFEEYISQPELSLKRTEIYRLLGVYKTYILNFHVSPVKLLEHDLSKLYPAVKWITEENMEAMFDALQRLTRDEVEQKFSELSRRVETLLPPTTKMLYGWSKYGGARIGMIKSNEEEGWYCQSCNEHHDKSESGHMYPTDASDREFLRLCDKCKELFDSKEVKVEDVVAPVDNEVERTLKFTVSSDIKKIISGMGDEYIPEDKVQILVREYKLLLKFVEQLAEGDLPRVLPYNEIESLSENILEEVKVWEIFENL